MDPKEKVFFVQIDIDDCIKESRSRRWPGESPNLVQSGIVNWRSKYVSKLFKCDNSGTRHGMIKKKQKKT